MSVTFYEPGPQRAPRVEALFGKIARRYDLLNDLQSFGLHRSWKKRVVRLARPQAGLRALDICCGTGDLAFESARQGLHVTGLDFTKEMLTVAAARQAKAKIAESAVGSTKSQTCCFVRADAQQLPFQDDSFDIVTVGYGLRNLADWELGLREMQRVAKPGGRLVVLEFGKPQNPILRGLYFAYLKTFVPVLGRVFCGDAAAYAYILESLKHYAAQQAVALKMQELGLVETRVINLLGGLMSINFAVKPDGNL
jgi:demethylmenaquinone methyltransferase/2-methoxy-6-polyprenyl-1,4-benzoquinol methylase